MGSIIGVDEAGRGPVIGPLVIAAVKLESTAGEQQLTEWGVRDSKKCTPKRRARLSAMLRKEFKYSIKTISAAEIDGHRETKTLNELEGEWFAEVINRLSPEADTTVIVDSADANESTFKRYIETNVPIKCEVISLHKADEKYPIVAAASIIAKFERDTQVQTIARELNVELGSGYPSDPTTINFLEKWIKEKGNLPPHTRHSWKTAQRLVKKILRTDGSLDQYMD
ncbi:ribonuclease HII [[Eubacterium] cellulosolvens]